MQTGAFMQLFGHVTVMWPDNDQSINIKIVQATDRMS